jgi:hypothetical protein
MDSSNLFSHPQAAESAPARDTSDEPVVNPTFSDGPEANARAAKTANARAAKTESS